MAQEHLIKLNCTKCKHTNYWTTKNRKQVERKIELEKFCKFCKAHQMHKEAKK